MRKLFASLVFALISFVYNPGAALAAGATAEGLWYSIDETNNKPTALVKLTLADGVLSGVVQKVMAEGAGEHPLCDRCEGDRRGKPVEGMTILWGLKQDADDAPTFHGGRVLDPKKGAVYKCQAKLTDAGTLEVRGFLGISLFGRTQKWRRAEPSAGLTPKTDNKGVRPRS